MAEYRIDDLARTAGASVRNVRVYQDRGLLPPPRREGRVGVYGDHHLDRLLLIGRLLDRGYTFATIRELLDARDLDDLLGVQAALTEGWTAAETPTTVTLTELAERFGAAATPELLERAERIGLLRPSGDNYEVPNRQLYEAAADLIEVGVPPADVLDLAEWLQRQLGEVAERFVATVAERLQWADGLPPHDEVPDFVARVRQLRPHARQTVDAILASAMEREVNRAFGELIRRVGAARAG